MNALPEICVKTLPHARPALEAARAWCYADGGSVPEEGLEGVVFSLPPGGAEARPVLFEEVRALWN